MLVRPWVPKFARYVAMGTPTNMFIRGKSFRFGTPYMTYDVDTGRKTEGSIYL